MTMKPVDLRSDTVTLPTEGMRKAMANAEVGDDLYGEDPTVRRLEEETAQRLGKEAALFVPSGTMSNQIALLAQTNRGDEVVATEGAHLAFYESGAAAALAGVQFTFVGTAGRFSVEDLVNALKPRTFYTPNTSLLAVENTHNRAGGRVFPQGELNQVLRTARDNGLVTHLDGARLWNASVATGLPLFELAEGFDSVSICYSKGLGAPVGSALVGSKALRDRALRFRKMLGGAMRQSGILAAGALYAMEHHLERIATDHEHALMLSRAAREMEGVIVHPTETNIVLFDLSFADAEAFVREGQASNLLSSAFGPKTVRLVTHFMLSVDEVKKACEVLKRTLQTLRMRSV